MLALPQDIKEARETEARLGAEEAPLRREELAAMVAAPATSCMKDSSKSIFQVKPNVDFPSSGDGDYNEDALVEEFLGSVQPGQPAGGDHPRLSDGASSARRSRVFGSGAWPRW